MGRGSRSRSTTKTGRTADVGLGLELRLEELGGPLDWAGLFGRPGRNAIEIGTGNGTFLEREAARLADWNFLGIERSGEFFDKMARRCARAGLTNVRAVRADGPELLEHRVAPASVARIYLLFSDPWPKRRHAGRRVMGEGLLALAERVLAPGGELWFRTDVGWYFNFAVTALRRRAGWSVLEAGRLPPAETPSNYESKARAAGIDVWSLRARPTSSLSLS